MALDELQTRYYGSFAFCALVCIVLQVIGYSPSGENDGGGKSDPTTPSKAKQPSSNSKFASFQTNYLVVFTLAMFSDWLQGPYVYELYVSYGFTQQQIAELFVCGFGSSMIVGTFVGGLADKCGRKIMCIMYCVTYISACFTKLVPEYWTLMLGRFLSGVSTSLLFSVFESWMVCEHMKQGFDSNLLGNTFSYATFGNGLCAVIAGLVANSAASSYGYVAPFVVAIAPLTLVALFVSFTWSENYGSQSSNSSLLSSLQKGFQLISNDSKIAALGLSQSAFEGAMYTFVFMWTPALKSMEEKIEEESESGMKLNMKSTSSMYLGLIFAVFMVCVMIGSSIFKIASIGRKDILKIPLYMHAVAFVSMAITTMVYENKFIVYCMFLIFETSVGVFYPAYGVIKSEKIPEEIRSSVMNIFRMPLNAFVVLLLLKIKNLSPQLVFGICTFTHGIAFASYFYFYINSLKRLSLGSGGSSGTNLLGSDSLDVGIKGKDQMV